MEQSRTPQDLHHPDTEQILRPASTAREVQFRYTGEAAITIRGFGDKHTYYFSGHAPILTVATEDVAVMRAYVELKEVR